MTPTPKTRRFVHAVLPDAVFLSRRRYCVPLYALTKLSK